MATLIRRRGACGRFGAAALWSWILEAVEEIHLDQRVEMGGRNDSYVPVHNLIDDDHRSRKSEFDSVKQGRYDAVAI